MLTPFFKFAVMKKQHTPFLINSISEMHELFDLPKPKHPLVSVINHSTIPMTVRETVENPHLQFLYDLYQKGI